MPHDNKLKVKKRNNHGQESPGGDFVVAGYTFKSQRAAEDAKDELNAIKYMSKKTNQDDPAQIYVLYNKILDKELFKTAVGLDYLKELQQYLYINKAIPNDRIKPIPINQDVQEILNGKRETAKNRSAVRDLERQSKHYKELFVRAMIINVFLVIAVIAMIYIAKTSSNSNIINYENQIQNKYASWQEELESREAAIKLKEKELTIK